MPDYETLDRIADSHNWLWGLAWLALVAHAFGARRWRAAAVRLAVGVAALAVAYGWAYADIALELWPRAGLDFSTHAAVAVAIAMTLWAISRWLGWIALVSCSLYAPLMVYQGYHGVGDIVSSAAVVAITLMPLVSRVRRRLAMPPPVAPAPG